MAGDVSCMVGEGRDQVGGWRLPGQGILVELPESSEPGNMI